MLKIVAFGTGSSAERLLAASAAMPGIEIVAFADNDARRIGGKWRGRPVWPASTLATEGGWDFVCIASQWHPDIAAQLSGLGISPERIGVFEPWGERGLVAGVSRLQELFPPRNPSTSEAVPGFEDDFAGLTLLKRLGFDPRVVLDVGASSGPWSVTCARVFPQAEYFLIEPLPHYDHQLLTEKAAGWHRVAVAVGSEEGEVTIVLPKSRFGAFGATILPFSSGAPIEGETCRVPLRKIDALLAEGILRPPDLVKLDVQGYETTVLAGGEQLWESAEVFFVELSLDRFWAGGGMLHEMIALFANRGFLPFEFSRGFRGDDGILKQIDCIFVRRDGRIAEAHHLWRHAVSLRP